MKCIRVIGQGIPIRLSDEKAREIVERDKDGEYCPKSVWKDFYDNSEYWQAHGGRRTLK